MKKLLFLIFLGSASLFGQGVYVPVKTVLGTVNGVTRPVAGATITVCGPNIGGTPCSPALANTVFQDLALTVPLSNPLFADSHGNYPQFAVAPGIYTITESAAGYSGFSYQIQGVCVTGGQCTVSSLTAGSGNFTGDITHNGHNDTGIGTLGATTLSGNPNFSGNPTFGGTIAVTGASTFSGTGNFKNLEAILFADQYGNGTTTGIAGAITAAGVVNKTNIWVPSTYATTETVPGSLPQWQSTGPGALAVQGGNSAANITFQDNRFGRFFTALDPKGDAALYNPNVQQWFRWNVNYIAGPSGQTANNRDALSMNLNALDGGFNFNNNTYVNKENYAVIDSRLTAETSGQHVGIQSFNTSYSVGDMVSFFGQQACYGGFTAGGDEGCEAFDFEAYHGNVEYTATIASGAATGATSLTLTPTTGGGTQGAYRFLIDITKISNAGTISAVTFTNGTTPVAITGVGTSFGTSNVNTTLGTAVTVPGVATVTPAAMTNITTSSVLCIADPFTFEHVTPTATTGTTFTANFRYAHPTTTVVMAGGACGNYIELVADRATTATFGSTSNVNFGGNVGNAGNVINTLHYIVPMIGSTSNTAATIWLTNPNNGYVAYRGRWTSGGTNTYAIYPGAQVTSVQGATSNCVNNSTCGTGNIGNVFTLESNNAAWANSDVVALPLYFSMNSSLGQMIFSNLFPQAGGTTLGSLSIQGYGVLQSGDSFVGITNSAPAALYTAGGGVLTPPYMITTLGSFDQYFRINTRPTGAFIVNLDNAGATTIYRSLNGAATQNDAFGYSPSANEFTFGNTGSGTFLAINPDTGSLRQKETASAAVTGSAGSSLIQPDSGDHMLKYNPNNAGVQNVSQVYMLTAQYTNSTTGFTTVGTPNIAFPVNANQKYTATCHLYYQAVATGGLNIQFTGPAAPTAVIYGLNEPVSATAFAGDSVATAFGTSLGSVVTTATTNFDAIVSFSLINGANAGTVTLQAKSSAAVQLQIQAGSYCIVQ